MSMKDRIKDICQKQNKTFKYVEQIAGLGAGYISKIDNSDHQPNYENLQKIANVLNVSVYDITGEKPKIDYIYTAENSNILLEINQDTELLSALEKYAKLSEDKKKSVVNMINLLSGE